MQYSNGTWEGVYSDYGYDSDMSLEEQKPL